MQTIEQMRAELMARGFEGYVGSAVATAHKETADSVALKLGITKEQFDALPGRDQRCPQCGRSISSCSSAQNCVVGNKGQ